MYWVSGCCHAVLLFNVDMLSYVGVLSYVDVLWYVAMLSGVAMRSYGVVRSCVDRLCHVAMLLMLTI